MVGQMIGGQFDRQIPRQYASLPECTDAEKSVQICSLPSAEPPRAINSSNNQMHSGLLVANRAAVSHKAGKTSIVCKPGAMALFVDNGETVTVYCLDQRGSGDVRVTLDNKHVDLLPGQQFVVTEQQNEEFQDVNPCHTISYRNPKAQFSGNGVKSYIADFSIVSAILAVRPLNKMLLSQDSHDQRRINELLKNATILSELTAVDGPYLTQK
jgi:hypothetical protein